ncbi:MAG: hypothetical protein ACRD0Z_08120 [Acidimicrobiales bacterium]
MADYKHVSAHHQEFVARYVLPAGLADALKSATTAPNSVPVALRGLRQWLRLHILAPDLVTMPSQAVDMLWAAFRHNTEAYAEFCKHSNGLLHHGPRSAGDDAPPGSSQAAALTYAMACEDEGLRIKYPPKLPILFTVDEAVQLPDGQLWMLNCEHEVCAVPAGRRCVRHELIPRVPDELPKQVRFDVPPDYEYHDAPSGSPMMIAPYGDI